ncbi:MAG: hypothetical protein LW630_12685 [Saprospiraceae bacterium]|nr:hypothetical protein [Saprospiraceae bacterium]
MRKILTVFILGLFLLTGVNNIQGQQVTVTLASVQVDSAASAAVDVTTDNFTNLLGIT